MFRVSGVGAIAVVWRPTPIDPIASIIFFPQLNNFMGDLLRNQEKMSRNTYLLADFS
jgi:hypothetical protein